MSETSDESFITDLYRHLLGRLPAEGEFKHWLDVIHGGLSDRALFQCFVTSSEYKEKHRVRPGHSAGHYYSPIIDPDEVRTLWRDKGGLPPDQIHGVDISIDQIFAFWERLRPVLATTDFPKQRNTQARYFYENNVFPVGDAATLRAVIGTIKPKRIVEIGSGFSSACMLDAMDQFGLGATELLCIEPYPDRLHDLLRPEDWKRIKLIEAPVQSVDLAVFDTLGADDILFIDSSHVLKAYSDVNFELFEILPRLKPGVLIHFHDIHYPFELPPAWIFETRYSWNEVYALRAFLMYNPAFKVLLFNNLFDRLYRPLIAETAPQMLYNPGGSIWLRKEK